ncbi:MAG: MBL fold metallo-hydrolase [Thermoproteota archaeon]
MVEVKILNGSASIGGNFVRLEDGDTVIVFDQGLRFDVMSRYYSGFIAPRGVAELRSIGVIPKPEWYEDVSTVYISHMHLDHLGALSNIPQALKVKLPSIATYNDMEEKWSTSSTWLSLIPRKYYVELEELQPLQMDENGVMALPVSHSAYPAYAFIFFGKDETVLYTGDFRVESFLNQSLFRELNQGYDLFAFLEEDKDVKIDTLIIEGTNIGSDRIPINPAEATEIMGKLVKGRRQLLATLHSLDVEYAYTLISIANKMDMQIAIASSPLARLLERIPYLPLKPQVVNEYVEYPAPFEATSIEDVKEKTMILVSYREMLELIKDLDQTQSLSEDCLAIISEPEPQIEEGSEYAAIANWLSLMGIESYRIRVSGHYYQYQLKTIIERIKPKKRIKIIHTERPKLFMRKLKEISRTPAE